MTTNQPRGGTAPPLNEYKVKFLQRRYLQTILGGVDLLVKGEVPLSVNLFQIAIFLFPAINGLIFLLLAKVLSKSNGTDQDIIQYQLICGGELL